MLIGLYQEQPIGKFNQHTILEIEYYFYIEIQVFYCDKGQNHSNLPQY